MYNELDDIENSNLEMPVENEPTDQDGALAKADLYKLANYSFKLFKKIQPDDQLESWVLAKITKSADFIASVYHYLEYEMEFSKYGKKIDDNEIYNEEQKQALKNKLMEAKEKLADLKKKQAEKLDGKSTKKVIPKKVKSNKPSEEIVDEEVSLEKEPVAKKDAKKVDSKKVPAKDSKKEDSKNSTKKDSTKKEGAKFWEKAKKKAIKESYNEKGEYTTGDSEAEVRVNDSTYKVNYSDNSKYESDIAITDVTNLDTRDELDVNLNTRLLQQITQQLSGNTKDFSEGYDEKGEYNAGDSEIEVTVNDSDYNVNYTGNGQDISIVSITNLNTNDELDVNLNIMLIAAIKRQINGNKQQDDQGSDTFMSGGNKFHSHKGDGDHLYESTDLNRILKLVGRLNG